MSGTAMRASTPGESRKDERPTAEREATPRKPATPGPEGSDASAPIGSRAIAGALLYAGRSSRET